MARNGNIPELLERFMEESGGRARWVTVNEIRNYFHLDETASPAISGFLRRIYSGTFLSFPYRVERIERVTLISKPHPRIIKKYLVTQRPAARIKKSVPERDVRTGCDICHFLTDYAAIEHFDRVLHENHRSRDHT